MRRFLVHLFMPHHTNNHRAKVLHVDSLFVFALLLLLFQLSLKPIQASFPDVLGFATSIYSQELFKYTNDERVKAGLAPLVYNEALSVAAQKKAEDMFAKNYWAHFGPDGEKPWDFINQAGYDYTIAGENLAKNFGDSRQVVNAWMASSSHRDNIMKAGYRDMGFAVVNGVLQGEETTLVVQMFGSTNARLASNSPAPVPTKPAVATPQRKVEVSTAGVFTGIARKPLIDITQLTRDMSFVVTGILIAVLALDGWLVAKRKIVRVVGHNSAHMMFLSMILIFILNSLPGKIL